MWSFLTDLDNLQNSHKGQTRLILETTLKSDLNVACLSQNQGSLGFLFF